MVFGNSGFSDGDRWERTRENHHKEASLVTNLRNPALATKPHSQASPVDLKNPTKGHPQGGEGQKLADETPGAKYTTPGAGGTNHDEARHEHTTYEIQDSKDDNGNQMAQLVTHYFTYPPADMSASSDGEDADYRAGSEEAGLLTWDYDGGAFDPVSAAVLGLQPLVILWRLSPSVSLTCDATFQSHIKDTLHQFPVYTNLPRFPLHTVLQNWLLNRGSYTTL